MLKKIIYFTEAVITMNLLTSATTVKITTLTALQSIIDNVNQNTLVIFDINHVLIMPTDEYTT